METEIVSVESRPHPISNTFHFVMTVLTCGLWIPVWIICARGHKTTTRAPVTAEAQHAREAAKRETMAAHVSAGTLTRDGNPDLYAGCGLPSAMACSPNDYKNALVAKYGVERYKRNDKGKLRLVPLHEMEAEARQIQALASAESES